MNWVEGHYGNANTQYNNTFVPNSYNKYTGNEIMPIKGGSKSRIRGGCMSGLLGVAATPAILLAMQNQISKKNIYKSRSYKPRKSRRVKNRSRRR